MKRFAVPDSSAFEDWLLLKREQLNPRMHQALSQLAENYERRGEVEPALCYPGSRWSWNLGRTKAISKGAVAFRQGTSRNPSSAIRKPDYSIEKGAVWKELSGSPSVNKEQAFRGCEKKGYNRLSHLSG